MTKRKYILILSVLLLIMFVSLFFIFKPYFDSNPSKSFLGLGDNGSLSEDTGEALDSILDIPVDFETLWKTNTDVYAWIRIPGTNVDYPIVQSEDNTYYLNHTWDHKEYKAGSIFTENYNSKDFEDVNTLIYGHRMYAGDMFAQLQNFAEADFFDKNRFFYIYTPDRIMTYEIIAAFPFGEEHLLFEYNFSHPDDFERFCEDVFGQIRQTGCHRRRSYRWYSSRSFGSTRIRIAFCVCPFREEISRHEQPSRRYHQ